MSNATKQQINTIKSLVDEGATVYAGNDGYKVIKSKAPSGSYLIKCAFNGDVVGLHGREGTEYECSVNMLPVYVYEDGEVRVIAGEGADVTASKSEAADTASHRDQILARLVDEGVLVSASIFIGDMLDTDVVAEQMPHTHKKLIECSTKDDYREPVKDAIRNGTAAMLWDIADRFGYTLTVGGVGVTSEEDAEAIKPECFDHAAMVADIETDNAWQAVAAFIDVEPYTVEALQYWLVSDWLARHLDDVGALVAFDVLGFNVWGRTQCGQGLHYDSDLRKVADVLEQGSDAT